jgi:hypothetical protein
MAADEPEGPNAPGMVPRLFQDFVNQLRTSTERLEDMARGRLPFPQVPFPQGPLPGAFSAAQAKALADSIAAQRRSIEAMQAQLSAFDEQLAAFEQILGPLAEWSRAWAGLEERLLNMGRKPEPGR